MTRQEECDLCDNKQCQCRTCRGVNIPDSIYCDGCEFNENTEKKCLGFMPIINETDIIVIEGEKPFKGTLSQFEKFTMGTNSNYDCVKAYCMVHKCTFEIIKEKTDGYT